jgi:3-hydroxyisobutyrate dehydrogenase
VLETDGEDIQNHEHSCFFSAAHAADDRGIALELARKLELDLPLARATKEQYDRLINRLGCGASGFSREFGSGQKSFWRLFWLRF